MPCPYWIAIVAALVLTFLLMGRRKAPRPDPDSRKQIHETRILADAAKIERKRSSSPETGSTSHCSSGTKYDVFLSFRGPDTRATFTDSLYHTLLDKGFSVFIDKQGIDIGEEIGPEIYQAIDDSKICIPIFSRDYASSSWCLRELEHMMQRWKTNKLEVMPIFYDVEPSDVKLETRVYADALTLHKEKRGAEIVQNWTEVLREVTGIKGWDTKSTGHGELARLIARKVSVKLKVSCVYIFDHLVGINESANEVVDLLNVESKDVRLIGIWGMGGIGKTTLAKVVYDKLSTNFDSCSFISDIQEASKGFGLLNVQRKLISDIIGDLGVELSSIDHGKNMIKNRFCRKKVLIVLDDVDQVSQLMALAAKKEWFGLGSRIVVTTRDKSVFYKLQDQFEHCLIYEVKELNNLTALQLFSKHTFRSNSPPNAFLSLSEKVVAKTGGLPLAIEVIGSLLCGKREESVWQDTLKKMEYCQQRDLKEKLMLSYQALDHLQQQIFLDIACFLAGQHKSYPFYMWDDCGFFPSEGIDVLLLMSLVKIGERSILWMHDQLKDLGRSIVYEEIFKDPTKGSRVWWDPWVGSDIVQQKKGIGTVAAYYNESKVPLQDFVLTSKDFIEVPNIRFLNLSGGILSGDFGDLFSELRWLTSYRCPKEMQVTNFCPKNLVILELNCNSSLDEHWGGWTQLKVATRLKVLNLSHCRMLKETPDLSAFLFLEKLILMGCKMLTKLSDSIGMLKYLVELDVSYTSIVELPNNIINQKSLKVLKIDGSPLQKLPDAIGMMETLKEIYGENCRQLEVIPSDIMGLPSLQILKLTKTRVENVPELPQSLVVTRLKVLNLSSCKMLKETPELSAFLSLEKLILNGCQKLTKLSDSIGMLKYLVELDVSCTSIIELPNSIVNLKSLKVLKIDESSIQKLPDAIGMMEKLEEIYGEGCHQLEVIPSDIVRLSSLRILKLTETLVENVPKLSQSLVATRLKVLNLSHCRMLKETPDLSAFLSLEKLILTGCKMLTKLSDSIGMLKYLVELDVSYTSIVDLPNNIVNLKSLKVLKINGSCLQKLPNAIRMMEKLEKIDGEDCRQLEVIPSDIVGLPSLQILTLTKTRVKNVPKLPESLVATRLKVLNLSHCRMLKETLELSAFLALEKLILKGCEMLTKLSDSIGMLKYLVELDVSCTSIAELPDSIVNLKSLKVLKIDGSCMQKLPDAIGMMEKLEEIYGEDCQQLEVIPSDILRLSSLQILKLTEIHVENVPKLLQSSVATRLKVLNLSHCRMLKETPDLSALLSLEILILTGCKMLTKLSDSIGMLEDLVQLDVSYTSIVELPNTIVNLKSLEMLKIDGSRMQKLPDAIGMMEKLENISAKCCQQLEVIPSDIVGLPSLQILTLTKTRVANVPKLPKSLVATRLKVLDMSNCRMLKETPELSAFLSLQKLILNGCEILTKVSDSIGMLKYLVELDVSYTSIVELPNNIVNLESLNVLKIDGSCMQKLPVAIGMMEKLEEIYGEGCQQLEVIPSNIVRLSSLRILKLTETRVENIPKFPENSVATRLKVLDLSNCRMLKETPELSVFLSLEKLILKGCEMLTKLSDSIGMLKYLVKLDVSYTSIVELPNSIVNLKKLKSLKIDGCRMQKLPVAIGMMEKLKRIYGEGCQQLEVIPSDIMRLSSLRILKLTETRVENIPKFPENSVATRVKVLDLSNCRMLKETPELSVFLSLEILILKGCEMLTKLSDSIGMLKYLVKLDVSYTSIVELPNSIVNLKKLKSLKIDGCRMQKLPVAIGMMDKLEEIYGEGCQQLEVIPSHIVRLSSLRILKLTETRVENIPKFPENSVATRLKVLDLSDCRMLKETPELSAFLSLEELILNGCEMLTKVSDSIGMLKYLVELDVSYTSIIELPNSIVNLKSLNVLKIDGSCMQRLPVAIGMMEKLEEIYGEGCQQLEVIPSDIVRLPSLRILKLTEIRVENIPKFPENSVATRLKVLDLSNCRMLKETPELSAFLSLEKLILNGCEMLTKVSDSIGMLKYLVELDVSYTSIVELPNSIVNLKSLIVLKIDGSCMQRLPVAIGMMEKLEEIYGEGCQQLEVIPSDIVRLPSLRILKLTEIRVENIPKFPENSVATRLKVLDLSNCRMLKETPELSAFLSLEKLILNGCEMLMKVSDSIGMLKYLVELDVSYTSIVELPDSIVNLKMLNMLKIDGCRMQKLPVAIGMMEKLEEIYGEGCQQLEVIPSDIVRLSSLRILKLTETRVENIPMFPENSVATRLKVLDLSNCRMLKETPELSAFLSLEKLILNGCEMLTKVSDSIGMLKYLVELDVSYTSIVELPNSIVNLNSLNVLKIHSCRMQKLPVAIGMMDKLEEIYVEGCQQLKVIPSDILRLSSLRILKLTETRVENIPMFPGNSVATRLKVLDLSDCRMLKETPELTAFLSLEKLILNGCEMLMNVSESIGMLKYLVELDVSYTSIVELPNSIVNLKSLNVLKIDGSCMQKLPDAIGMMEKLEEIYGEGCRQLEVIPSDIVGLSSLQILKLTETRVENVPKLPESLVSLCLSSTVSKKDPKISNLVNLRNLELCFPLIYPTRPMIPEIYMSSPYCKLELSVITSKSSYLGCFRCLKVLELKNCDNLRCVGQLPSDLRIFRVTNCRFLEVVDLSNLSNFNNLEDLLVWDCSRLVEIRGLDRLESLKSLYIGLCSPLLRLPDLSTWKELTKWDVDALVTNLVRGKQVARSDDLPL